MKFPSLGPLILICLTAVIITGLVTDAIRPQTAPAAPAAPDPNGFRLLTRITDLERELGHREAELDALTDQLDSAVAELHAAGALLEKHGLKLHDDANLIEQ